MTTIIIVITTINAMAVLFAAGVIWTSFKTKKQSNENKQNN